MMDKKLRRKLIASLVSVVIAFIMLAASSTTAWLSMNKVTVTDTMTVSSEVSSNLIIDTVKANVTSKTSTTGVKTSVSQSETATLMRAATSTATTTSQSTSSNLKYVTNPEDVSMTTGLGTATLNFATATNPTSGDSGKFYIDYTVYIGVAGADWTDMTSLVATVDATDPNPVSLDTHQALSIDIYVDGTYKDTINLGKTQTSDSLISTGGITMASPKTVLLRVYFDGALEKTTGQAYINSNTVKSDNITIKVTFTAS